MVKEEINHRRDKADAETPIRDARPRLQQELAQSKGLVLCDEPSSERRPTDSKMAMIR